MRTVLVTGAAGGIGQATCSAFKADGWRVVATDLRKPERDFDAYVEIDLDRFAADATARADALRRLRAALREGRVDALVNNAAVQILGATPDVRAEDWERSFRVNVTAPFLLTQGLLPELERAKGCVVNIASIHATLTKPAFVTYATTKAALVGLTRSLAVDLGPRGVRVNAIAPAAIETPMLREGLAHDPHKLRAVAASHPIGRVGSPQEVAQLACFLAANVHFATGSILDLNGGVGARLSDTG